MSTQKLMQETISFAIKLGMVFVALLLAIWLGTSIFFATAAGSNPSVSKEMSVQGKAEKKVTPDSAKITLGKNVRGSKINEIQKTATDAINSLVTKLKALKITDAQIKTSNYSLSPVYNNDGDIKSYTVNISVEVTLEKTNPQDEMVSKVINAGSEAGVDEVRNLYFYLDDQDKAAKDLEEEAIADAKATAQKRAAAAGARLGKVLRVDFGGGYYPYAVRDTAAAAEGGKATPSSGTLQVQPGTFDLTTTVTVVYELL